MQKIRVLPHHLMEKTITEIKKHAPWSQGIQIRMTEAPKGHYNTLITLKRKGKDLIAKGADSDSPAKSMAKTRAAILRQIEKIHRKKRKVSCKEYLEIRETRDFNDHFNDHNDHQEF